MKSKKYKKVCSTLNYTKYFLILVSAKWCVSVLQVYRITISAIGLDICAITAGIKKYKSVIKKKKKKHYKIVLLRKTKLNSIEYLIFKTLIDSYISHNKFVLVNNVLNEYVGMKEKIKNLMS